jgi:substrate import-associated zinc metallohydrolase lipoprotein
MKTKIIYTLIILQAFLTGGCYDDEKISLPVKSHSPSEDELDLYIQENFIDEYGVAVRYKFVDRYVDPNKRVTPPERDVVKPMLDFLSDFWIEPFLEAENGEEFFRRYVPAEVIFIGSAIFNSDGTITLGVADAGARITLTEVNILDTQDEAWIFRQLGTIYHEFAHIMHQRYNLPPNWKEISPEGYTSSGSWYNLTDEEALQRGFVSPYATSSFNEDFAELVAFLLYHPDFYKIYIDDEVCTTTACEAQNSGRAKLRTKYNAILNHYKQNTGVDLLEVRKLIQEKLP